MKNHNSEKQALEESALQIFLDIYNSNFDNSIKVKYKQEKPDYVLSDIYDNLFGIEVTHLYYDSIEAMMMYGRSDESIHGIESLGNLIEVLNNLLIQKEEKINNYICEFPVSLLVRNASPIFGMSDFLQSLNRIYTPKGIEKVWFLSRDGSSNEWLLKDLLEA